MSSTTRPRAFCELPAGLASVSLRLHGGPHCRPPISRMGNKAGYAEVILAALGLRSGQGAGAYVWAEADPDVRALLRAYPDADMLRRIADIIRGWKDEEPRALWERLRAERKARGPAVEPDVAKWAFLHQGSFQYKGPDAGIGRPEGMDVREDHGAIRPVADIVVDACHRLAEYASIVASNRLIHVAGPDLRNTGQGGTTFGGEAFATPVGEVADRVIAVAGFAWLQSRTTGGLLAGNGNGPTMPKGDVHHPTLGSRTATCAGTARNTERLASRWPPVAVLATLPTAAELSAMLGTPGDLEGVVVYGDADYRDTTGYAHTCREMMPDLSRGWAAMGAVVCLSEAEPYPELPTWHACEITGGRKGQKRTFSKQQREWLTMNREPAHRVAVQASLFGAA